MQQIVSIGKNCRRLNRHATWLAQIQSGSTQNVTIK